MNDVSFPDLEPAALVDELASLSRDDLQAKYPGVVLLIVELRDDASELPAGLSENFGRAGRPPRPATVSAATTATFPALRASVTRPSLEGMDRVQLLAKLSAARHFVLPLFKRQGAAVLADTQVSIGRGEDSDVVLRDSSISKLHAWLQLDTSGALYLFDAGSLNGTRVNGKLLQKEEACWIQPMDQLQFGTVAAFICAAPVLRSVLRSLSAAKRALGTLETP